MINSKKNKGFTFVELISVFVIMGIMSAVIAPKFMANDGYESLALRDKIISGRSLAKSKAAASRRYVCVTVISSIAGGGSVAFSEDTRPPETISAPLQCSSPLVINTDSKCQSNEICSATETITPVTFAFSDKGEIIDTNNLGVYSQPVILNLPGIQPIYIDQETGYAK